MFVYVMPEGIGQGPDVNWISIIPVTDDYGPHFLMVFSYQYSHFDLQILVYRY